jgi:hypothetical protein
MRTTVWSEELKERDHFGELGIEWGIILKWILTNSLGECGLH